jgi:hypothetical protein
MTHGDATASTDHGDRGAQVIRRPVDDTRLCTFRRT